MESASKTMLLNNNDYHVNARAHPTLAQISKILVLTAECTNCQKMPVRVYGIFLKKATFPAAISGF